MTVFSSRSAALTSKTGKCALWSRFLGRSARDAGGFYRHKSPRRDSLRPSDFRADQSELALKGFPGVPNSAMSCQSLFDQTELFVEIRL